MINSPEINKIPIKVRLVNYFLPIVMLFFGCLLGNNFDYQYFNKQVELQHLFILKRAIREKAEIAKIFTNLNYKNNSCSAQDINDLKKSLYQAKFIADIGLIVDGKILCTAISGLTSGSNIPYAERRYRADGSAVISGVELSSANKEHGLLFMNGSVVIFANDDLYDDLATEGVGSVIQVNAEDKEIIYWHSKALDNYRTKQEGIYYRLLWPGHRKTSCLNEICVTSEFRVSCRLNTLILALLGLMIGILLALAIGMRWRARHGLRYRLIEAMRSKQIFLEYQPLVAVDGGRVVGAEALARWRHSEVGQISPDTFIPLIQKLGLGRDFTRYVVRMALDELQKNLKSEADFYVGINVFPDDLEDNDFFEFLLLELERISIPAKKIVLEVTEGSQFSVENPSEIFQLYRASGIRIYIDDFGVGYSNISRIIEGGIDGIKLDRVFIRSIDFKSKSNNIFESVVAMTEKIGVQIVIEGVETIEQHDHVLSLAPKSIGQGWHYGRPGPASSLTVG
ncbi:EAL domain-containing protein [Comamonas sp. C24C]